ncbi:MAG: hypothetical protein QXT45_07945 [Candidatus Bilamarchaeaceae archaeon]
MFEGAPRGSAEEIASFLYAEFRRTPKGERADAIRSIAFTVVEDLYLRNRRISGRDYEWLEALSDCFSLVMRTDPEMDRYDGLVLSVDFNEALLWAHKALRAESHRMDLSLQGEGNLREAILRLVNSTDNFRHLVYSAYGLAFSVYHDITFHLSNQDRPLVMEHIWSLNPSAINTVNEQKTSLFISVLSTTITSIHSIHDTCSFPPTAERVRCLLAVRRGNDNSSILYALLQQRPRIGEARQGA